MMHFAHQRNAFASLYCEHGTISVWTLGVMYPRASHIFTVLDYGIGAFFLIALFVFGVIFFTITGPVQPYEMKEFGGAYSKFLANIEGGARDLRADYCARAGDEAPADAACG
jgi:hypothetical protein